MDTVTNWMIPGTWTDEDGASARLVCFRARLNLTDIPKAFPLRMTAACRYKLYVNGRLAQFGPAKGDDKVWFIDTLDISDFLAIGENVIAAAVLRYPENSSVGNHSLFRAAHAGLYVEGTDPTDWRCHVNRNISFPPEEERFAPLCIHEIAAEDEGCSGWTLPGFDDSDWEAPQAWSAETLPIAMQPENLIDRAIPFMRRNVHTFELPVRNIPAHSERQFVLDAGEEMCAFLRLRLRGGEGANIDLLYSECYVQDNGKGHRLDAVHGHLSGYGDHYTAAGGMNATYEPFWFRTFRFVQVTVHTADAPIFMDGFEYEETGYPLKVLTRVETSDSSLSDIWDISLRTLRRCMHDTYMDCPYYEQLQYVMDTRSEILYTYAVSADDRLARQAIDDFSRSQRRDGLLNASYPNVNENVIPGFSMYYILMVHDHMMYFGDKALVRRCLPVIDRCLGFFARHLTRDGLVDKVGGVNGKARFWSFIDWSEPWLPTEGMPTAGLKGPIAMESLLYLLGLQKAAELAGYVGEAAMSKDYGARAERLRAAIRTCCMTPDGMISDGPGSELISQHGQVFGVLTGTLSPEEGRHNLLRTIDDPSIPQCTVSMCFYLFRALEATGLYACTDHYWNIWRRMLNNGCTTCVESEGYARSECHAWGALALYELPSAVLGVRPAAPGYGVIEIRPATGALDWASGTVHTPLGNVGVSWTKNGGVPAVRIDCNPELYDKIRIKKAI